MNLHSFDKVIRRVRDSGMKFARIYEGRRPEYPKQEHFFEFFEVDAPKELEDRLIKFQNENTGKYTVFLGVNSKNAGSMAAMYFELKPEKAVNGLSQTPDNLFFQYLIDRNNKLEDKLEQLIEQKEAPASGQQDIWVTIADRVSQRMFGPDPGPPAASPQLNGLNKDAQEKEIRDALATLLEVFGPQTIVNLAEKVQRPENSGLIDTVKNFANG